MDYDNAIEIGYWVEGRYEIAANEDVPIEPFIRELSLRSMERMLLTRHAELRDEEGRRVRELESKPLGPSMPEDQ